jgi:Na+/proline symporter
MSIEKTISKLLNIGGLVMAAVFLIAIVFGVIGHDGAVLLAQIGILAAVVIPIVGLIVMMIMLFKKGETNYGVCAIILLVFLIVMVIWRLNA